MTEKYDHFFYEEIKGEYIDFHEQWWGTVRLQRTMIWCQYGVGFIIVLQELRLKYRQISTTFYKKTHNNLINSIKSKLDSLYHTDITKILQLIY